VHMTLQSIVDVELKTGKELSCPSSNRVQKPRPGGEKEERLGR
jgi:hypothetical protein